MIDSKDAINRVHAGEAPSNWLVFFAKKDFFIGQAAIFFILIIVLIAFFVWFTLNPHVTVTRGFLLHFLPGPISRFITDHFSEFLHLKDLRLWRGIDYIAGVLLGGFFLLMCIESINFFRKPQSQLLLLLPEGVILLKGDSKPTVIEYASLSDIFISEYKSDKIKLTIENKQNGEEKNIEIDERFGNPKKFARDITEAFKAYNDQQKD